MKLDTAFANAVVLAWEDLAKTAMPCSVRVEYRSEVGTPLDYLGIWSVGPKGHQFLVCDYWTCPSQAHPGGVRFWNGHHSDRLAQALDFLMKNQDQFTRPPDAFRDGIVLIDPPTEVERTQAATWMIGLQGAAADVSHPAHEKAPPLQAAV